MPISKAPYKRSYQHTSSRGNEQRIRCAQCGCLVPRWKTFEVFRGFRITDPTILKQVDRRMLSFMQRKERVCPKCARFYHIVKRGKSERKKGAGTRFA
ncbi:MAG: hypothetical protein COY38_00325 [Candidatus Aenigmarchaeota archaeon CG_4_10_14_0_8_um_filter_37_24]|nr:hypothetical protein [Candidatus Aenigmarchaeota archaeon]PIX50963.1 MAG: hypothetical protein COZ52_01335 [Candidatus Aenigmarchaeota archaeon CG_4_8_14_3_um_filter_37_24]PIY36362.1 MAG: hypothetical protein COZ04_00555 [Candidatus Aenigmarchaeota archaeon CG_4_10_14_3_um_filter_37_21]PIZ36315.1 MAG: hypothetical protein COY38_00325 [Candidatus Aenigmarchaeota archaeon CG_4_10_14_0_8_um_filter_37_24]PJB75161.1 MAG: hypothetical protein CO092_02680 [Candidatus Aenigmarchaeota archaeon CG_4_9